MGAEVGPEGAERGDDAEDRSEQSEHRRDHPNIGQINNAVIQTRRHPGSFGFGDLADLGEISAWILRRKVEDLLDDARDCFPVAIGDGQEAQIIPFPQERVGRRHESARNN